jgi:uncharacterized RDD family membrane protein YckC
MSYPPDPNNPYGQQPPAPGYGYPQQTPPPAPGYGYPQQQPAPGYGAPAGYGIPQQQGPYGNGAQVQAFYAGWGSRVAALVVDFLIIGVVPGILYGIGIGMTVGSANCTTDPVTYHTSCSGGGGSAFGSILIMIGGLIALAGSLWLLYQEGTTGQTPGKKMVNIRVLREADGQPIGFGMAIVRRICHAVDEFACCVGFLWPLWDAKKQTFADKIMGTVVVKSQ